MGLTPAIIGKTFFSTRRPAPEAGGQRPTARCALGRKGVWIIVFASAAEARRETQVRSSSPAKVGDPVTENACSEARPGGGRRGTTAQQLPHPEEPRSS